jgi:hypothetical protein
MTKLLPHPNFFTLSLSSKALVCLIQNDEEIIYPFDPASFLILLNSIRLNFELLPSRTVLEGPPSRIERDFPTYS